MAATNSPSHFDCHQTIAMLEAFHLYNTAQVEWDDFSLGSNYDGYKASSKESKADQYIARQSDVDWMEPIKDEKGQQWSCRLEKDTIRIETDRKKARRRRISEMNRAALEHASELIQTMRDMELSLNNNTQLPVPVKEIYVPQLQQSDFGEQTHLRTNSLIESLEEMKNELSPMPSDEPQEESEDETTHGAVHNRQAPLHEYTVPCDDPTKIEKLPINDRDGQSQGRRQQTNAHSIEHMRTVASAPKPESPREETKAKRNQRGCDHTGVNKNASIVGARETSIDASTQQNSRNHSIACDLDGKTKESKQDQKKTENDQPRQDKVLDFLARSRSVIQNAQRVYKETSYQNIRAKINYDSASMKKKEVPISATCRHRIRMARISRLSKGAASNKEESSKDSVACKRKSLSRDSPVRTPKLSGWKSFGVLAEHTEESASDPSFSNSC
eukprot:scaffold2362_cov109-Cylindrotheca_fusiformis.AAC.3